MIFKILLVIFIIYLLCKKRKEHFTYDDKRMFFYCKYKYGQNFPGCRKFFSEMTDLNKAELIGILHSTKNENERIFNLYKKKNEESYGFNYYIKDKKPHGTYVYRQIDINPKDRDLYTDEQINIPNMNMYNPFTIKLYSKTHPLHLDCSHKLNNICQNKELTYNPYNTESSQCKQKQFKYKKRKQKKKRKRKKKLQIYDKCEECNDYYNKNRINNDVCSPSTRSFGTRYEYHYIPWNKVGHVDRVDHKDEYFFHLYEKEIDATRNIYQYYIEDEKYDVKIELNETKYLFDKTEINIDGKVEKYVINRYDMQHPSYNHSIY